MTKTELLKIAKPILFNTEMTRAILDGRKTVTRRVVKTASPQWEFEDWCDCAVQTIIDRYGNEKAKDVDGLWATFNAFDEYIEFPMIKSRYNVGDILYVRETWAELHLTGDPPEIVYKADGGMFDGAPVPCWRPSIHMPKEAARIFLRVTGVRVERLREITSDGCFAEGVGETEFYDEAEHYAIGGSPLQGGSIERCAFLGLWNSTLKPADLPLYGWEANPWVWVYEFEKVAPK